MTAKLCHCGRPLHYLNPEAEKLVQALVDDLGEYVRVETAFGAWMVPRHFIALHGITADDIQTLGFERAP